MLETVQRATTGRRPRERVLRALDARAGEVVAWECRRKKKGGNYLVGVCDDGEEAG